MKRTRVAIAAVVVTAGAAFFLGTTVAPAPSSAVSSECAPDVTPTPAPTATSAPAESSGPDVSGTIRWVNSTTWTVLDDAGHTPTGIASVQVMADRVRVNYTFTAEKVSSFQATPDESFASADVRVGASVGLSYTDVFFYMPSYGASPVPPKLLSKAGANVWLTGWFKLPDVQ